MPTNCWSEDCPKCGKADGLYIEDRYGERRAECTECGYFYERADDFEREGVITRPERLGDEPFLLTL